MARPSTWLVFLCTALGLSACGGGAGDGVSSSAVSDASHGALTVALDGGAYRDVSNVYVTVKSVALHTDANRPWDASDTTWKVVTLNLPVVVDLTKSVPTQLFSARSVPAGTYKQLRLNLVASDGNTALVQAARDAGLQFNAQVNHLVSGNLVKSLLTVNSSDAVSARWVSDLTIAANDSYYFVIQADIDHSLVRQASGFAWAPTLNGYEISLGNLGGAPAISGTVQNVCTATVTTNCASDVVVSAQRFNVNATPPRYEMVRQKRVGADGGFSLFPLPPQTDFDVVITGRNMRTMVVKHVVVPAFVHNNTLDVPNWTVASGTVSLGALTPVITSASLRSVQLSPALATNEQKRLYFGQTVPDAEGPHEVVGVNVDPVTGLLARPFVLPDEQLQVASFVASGNALSFLPRPPQEAGDASSPNFSVVVIGSISGKTALTKPVSAASATTSDITVTDVTP